MNTQLLHNTLRQFRGNFLAFFTALTAQDYHTLLEEESETLLALLQDRYGYTRDQAKTAWNEFVLRYVDGHDANHRASPARNGATSGCLSLSGARKQNCWRQQRKGAPMGRRDQPVRIYH